MKREIFNTAALLIGLFFLVQTFMFYQSAEHDPSFLEAMSGDVFSDIFPKEWEINLDKKKKIFGDGRRFVRQKYLISNPPISLIFQESKNRYSPDTYIEIGFFEKNSWYGELYFLPLFTLKSGHQDIAADVWRSNTCHIQCVGFIIFPGIIMQL